MKKNQNKNPDSAMTPDLLPASAGVPEEPERGEYLDEGTYEELRYDSKCMSCAHWNGSKCCVHKKVCDYRFYKDC